MKTFVKNIILFITSALLGTHISSCSDKEIQPDPTSGLIQIASGYVSGAGIRTEVYAPQELFAGYNAVFLALYDSASKARITQANVRLIPEMQMTSMKHSCPVENPPVLAEDGLFPAAIMFTMPSGDMGTWSLQVEVDLPGMTGETDFNIEVKATSPPRVLSFVTPQGERFYLSYLFPEKLRTGVNNFEIIAFRNHDGKFIPAEDLSIQVIPEMPSMDHGSPNNVDPIHTGNGHYRGKVNFTMTGEWRINLDLSTTASTIGTKYFDVNVD